MSDNHGCEIKFEIVRRCDVYPAFDPKEHVINSPEELNALLSEGNGAVVIMPPEMFFAWMEQFKEDDEPPH